MLLVGFCLNVLPLHLPCMLDMVRFVELGSILEPGRPPKTDKAAILIDAVRMVTQLRGEAQKMKDTNMGLQEKIKELKVKSQFIFSIFFFFSF